MANILVADDDEQYPFMLAKTLRNDQHNVVIAKDGAEALNLFESQKFDLIITDILMPNVDGIDLMMNLIECNSNIPVIAISGGQAAMFRLQSASTLGANFVLTKPFTNECFLNTVRRALV